MQISSGEFPVSHSLESYKHVQQKNILFDLFRLSDLFSDPFVEMKNSRQ